MVAPSAGLACTSGDGDGPPATSALSAKATPTGAATVDDGGGQRPITSDEAIAYPEDIIAFNQFADIPAFDVYPVPSDLTRYTTPQHAPDVAGVNESVEARARWLRENSGGKPFGMVLQPFAYEWQLRPEEREAARRRVQLAATDAVRATQHGVWGGRSRRVGGCLVWAQPHPCGPGESWENVLATSRAIVEGSVCE